MKTKLPFVLFALLACSAVGYAQSNKQSTGALTAKDVTAIKDASATYTKLALSQTWGDWAKLFAADAVFLPPHSPMQSGRGNIEAFAHSYPPLKELRIEPIEIEGSGELAFVRGSYSFVAAPPNQPEQRDSGKYVELWRKQTDGTWKLYRDIYNSDLPMLAPAAMGDTSQPRVIVLEYLKLIEGKTLAQYAERQRDYWKPINEELAKQGKINWWKVCRVAWPNGEGQEYDFVHVTEYPNIGHIDDPANFYPFAQKVIGEANHKLPQSTPIARLVRADVLLVRAATVDWSSAKNTVLAPVYMKSLAGKGDELMALQRRYYLPMNEEVVKAGAASGWATSEVLFPAGDNLLYDYVSFNGYESLTQMEKEMPQEWRDKWRARSQETEALQPSLRKRIKGELWRVMEQAAASKPTT